MRIIYWARERISNHILHKFQKKREVKKESSMICSRRKEVEEALSWMDAGWQAGRLNVDRQVEREGKRRVKRLRCVK